MFEHLSSFLQVTDTEFCSETVKSIEPFYDKFTCITDNVFFAAAPVLLCYKQQSVSGIIFKLHRFQQQGSLLPASQTATTTDAAALPSMFVSLPLWWLVQASFHFVVWLFFRWLLQCSQKVFTQNPAFQLMPTYQDCSIYRRSKLIPKPPNVRQDRSEELATSGEVQMLVEIYEGGSV